MSGAGRVVDRTGAVSPAVEALEAALAAVVRRANLPRSRERLIARANIDLDPAAYVTLSRIDANAPLRLSELAALLDVDISTASRQVSSLERDGLVRRVTDASDRRAADITPTDPGRRALESLRAARQATLRDLLADWDPADVESIARLLTRLTDALSP